MKRFTTVTIGPNQNQKPSFYVVLIKPLFTAMPFHLILLCTVTLTYQRDGQLRTWIRLTDRAASDVNYLVNLVDREAQLLSRRTVPI